MWFSGVMCSWKLLLSGGMELGSTGPEVRHNWLSALYEKVDTLKYSVAVGVMGGEEHSSHRDNGNDSR